MEGFGTDEENLILIVTSNKTQERLKIKKAYEEKNLEKKVDEGNIDFEKYIETCYYCLDDLKNENDKLCLAQFLRFLNCFLEEAFNPKENKEKIIKMFNPKK